MSSHKPIASRRSVRLAEAIHAMALGLWGGALIASGIVAAIIFPMMRDANVQLPAFANYPDPHWPIAAGQVMNRAFLIVDGLGVAALAVAFVTFVLVVLQRKTRHIGAATAIRAIALGMLAVVTGYALASLRPSMQSALREFWGAAKRGDVATAAVHRDAFDALHPTASFVMGTQLVLILVALIAGIMCATVGPREPGADNAN
ncbi:MAG: hypothetical protein KDA20_01475 [Phycisphaerales bacterium]|nr:hypothetical protein [Phycisphaerales bacterium]